MQQVLTIPRFTFPGLNDKPVGRKALANRRYRARKRGEDVALRFRPWTDEECGELKSAYENNRGNKAGWLRKLAASLGRNVPNLVRKAKALGIQTDRKRTIPLEERGEKFHRVRAWRSLTKEQKKAIRSERARGLWERHIHPRGMLGKHHTESVCQQMSASRLGKPRKPFTDEHRMKISQACVRRLGVNPSAFSRNLNRGLAGRRDDLGGQYFRSRYEANYARFLNFTNQKWEYEKKTFWFLKIKRGVRSYTPDFYLPELNEYHEVKGWMDAKSKTKLKRMKKYHPDVKVVVVDGEWFKAANKQGLCRLIPGWECNHKRH